MTLGILDSVRYVKNGRRGCWWPVARDQGQVHAGWSNVSHALLVDPGDFVAVQAAVEQDPTQNQDPGARRRDFNQLRALLDQPSRHVWITIEDSYLWWCTVQNGATPNPQGGGATTGNFWLTCTRPWSNKSLGGRLLAISDLPGIVSRVAGFRGTVCEPKGAETILRVIRDERDPSAAAAAQSRAAYEQAVGAMIQQLTWQDFEHLVDMILARTAWTRISKLGGVQEGYDIEAKNLAADEIAFVQVKGSASQSELLEYVERFQRRRESYDRMIFAVHSPEADLIPPKDLPVQVWTGDRLARLVVRLGLGEWVETRLN